MTNAFKHVVIVFIFTTATCTNSAYYSKTGASLFQAINNNNPDQVRKIIAQGGNINYNNLHISVLITAINCKRFRESQNENALHKNLKIIAMLLENGADAQEKRTGTTPLQEALQVEHATFPITQMLLDHGANIECLTPTTKERAQFLLDSGELETLV